MDFKTFNEEQATIIGSQSSAVTGPMVGKIDECKVYEQDGKTIAEFTITPVDGRKTLRFVKLQLEKEDKTKGFGFPQWNAIRGLLRLTSPASLNIEEAQAEIMNVTKDVSFARGMEGKILGFLMQRNNWGIDDEARYYKYSMNIVLPYDRTTKQTYAEKKNNQKAIKMEQRASRLTDRTASGLGIPSAYANSAAAVAETVDDTPKW